MGPDYGAGLLDASYILSFYLGILGAGIGALAGIAGTYQLTTKLGDKWYSESRLNFFKSNVESKPLVKATMDLFGNAVSNNIPIFSGF
ncbi:MAG: hypothetical protein H0U75_11805 [Legionella sp.]|nr:hypothetical protein [Legionella sp.]